MLMQYFREKFSQEGRQEGRQEGKQEGKQEGRREGKQEAFSESLIVILKAKFGTKGLKSLQSRIKKIADAEKLKALIEVAAKATSPQEVLNFIEAEKLV